MLEGRVDHVTTTNIAQRASIPVGSVYRYFEDRTHILDQLYRTAYTDVENSMIEAQAAIDKEWPINKTIQYLLRHFWLQARAHPSFRVLTRWANQHYSMWDVMPGTSSNLTGMIKNALRTAGVNIDAEREPAATKTMVTAVSVLIDMLLEEDNEQTAAALMKELAVLLEAYIGTFSALR